MDESTTTRAMSFASFEPCAKPGLLLAYAPPGASAQDRCEVQGSIEVGRHSGNHLCIKDENLSKRHFRIDVGTEESTLTDLGSTNGTFVDGNRVAGTTPLRDGAVIRVGQSVLVFVARADEVLAPPLADTWGFAGQFHAPVIVRALKEASSSRRHVLLTGPSGSGKELAARAYARMLSSPTAPFIAHNAARFATPEEAATTIFGIAPRVFSGVDGRPGLIERAEGGVLFIDEVHNLPERLQRTILRVLEDGEFERFGAHATAVKRASVRFVFASNEEGETKGLAHDLFARLRVVSIPPLAERVADIPSIFKQILVSQGLSQLVDGCWLHGDHYETLCLDGFRRDNVRGLVDVVDRLASKLQTGALPPSAVTQVFSERFQGSKAQSRRPLQGPYSVDSISRIAAPCFAPGQPTFGCDLDEKPTTPGNVKPGLAATCSQDVSSHYERYRTEITASLQMAGGNVSLAVRDLAKMNIHCTNRWLAEFADRWNLPRNRRV